jgi:hypothetical protein
VPSLAFRASVTMAMDLPRRSATVLAHCTMGVVQVARVAARGWRPVTVYRR